MDVCRPQYRKHTVALCIAVFMCVFGYYGISFISVRFFSTGEDLGDEPWKHNKLYVESLISASSEIPGLFLGMVILDRIGRKMTMLISFSAFSMTSFALVFDDVQNTEWLGVVMVFTARLTVSLGFTVIYIYFSEYYPTNIRSTALGMAASLGKIAGISTGFVSEELPFSMGILLYAISGVIALIAVGFVSETMGHNLRDSISEVSEWLKDNTEQSLEIGPEEDHTQGMLDMKQRQQCVSKHGISSNSLTLEDSADRDQRLRC